MMKFPKIPSAKLQFDPSISVQNLIDAYIEYKTIRETELTKRKLIEGQRDVAIERIRCQTKLMENFLENNFKERSLVLNKMFEALDKGIDNKDDHAIDLAMTGIINTIKTSPLSGINQLIAQIEDKNVDVVEI